MMDAPKCKVCGTRHYGICTHRVEVAGPVEVRGVEPQHVITNIQKGTAITVHFSSGSLRLNPGEQLKFDPISGKPIVTKPFDRNAYQREYMRKRRAAQNAQKA